MDGLLKRALRAGDPEALGGGPCLEPERLAAWADAGLSADDARAVELHLSNCARCQAMAAAFAASDVEAAAVSGNVVPITAKRPIRWALPMAVGAVAASLLLWVGTRDQRQPEQTLANASPERQAREIAPSAPAASAATQPAERNADQSEAKQLSASRREARTADPKAAPTEQLPTAGLSTAARSDAQRAASPTPPVSVAIPPPSPPPPPPPAIAAPRPATVSGLPQSSINVTIDGVRQTDPSRSSETFFAVAGVVSEFASPPSSRQDALEASRVVAQSATVAGAAGGAGRGGGGRGGDTFRSGTAEARGSIEGTARDTSGAALPGATILAKDLSTGATSTAVTDGTGGFRFSSLAPGRYSVTATLAGFTQQVVDNVVVENDRASRVSFPLAAGALSETVTVSRAGGGAGRGGGATARDAAAKSEPVASNVTRWRIHSDNRVERSRDAGLNWQGALIEVGLPAITTGVAPSTNVCWLIGRAGLVLVTSDALTFRRVAAPANIDLRFVQATDALSATVTAADGRRFTTADGGLTWK